MVKSRHNDGSIAQAEDSGKDKPEVGGQSGVHHVSDGVSDRPADGSHHHVGHKHSGHQGTEGNHDHADHSGTYFTEEFLQIHQHKAGHHGSDHLSLVTDHFHLGKAEIPHRDLVRRGRGHVKAVEQLGGNQSQAQHNTKDLRGSHLLGDGPYDAHGQQPEHRLADQPQKAIHAGPELGDLHQSLGAVLKKRDAVDDVAEAQHKTAADQGRDNGGKDLAQIAHHLLQPGLVGLCRLLCRILAHALDARVSRKLIVKGGYVVSDDHLELPRLGKSSLDAFDFLNGLYIRFLFVRQHKTHSGHAVGNR